MREDGVRLAGIEVGNAWDLRVPGMPTNWIVGEATGIDPGSLRFVGQGPDAPPSRGLAMKVFVHDPDDDPAWGGEKPTSVGRTLSMLAGVGEFELTFTRGGPAYRVTLDRPNDFAVWGPGLGHSWRPIRPSTIVTLRWMPGERAGAG